MSEPTFLCLSLSAWTALATVAMAFAAVASVVVSVLLRRDQNRLEALQAKALWLQGALESHSMVMLRLKAEQMGKKVVWWDPNAEAPPVQYAHGQSAILDTVYAYLPPNLRKPGPKVEPTG